MNESLSHYVRVEDLHGWEPRDGQLVVFRGTTYEILHAEKRVLVGGPRHMEIAGWTLYLAPPVVYVL